MIGQTVSHYRVLDKLGGGGMGVVYKAEDTRLGRQVALKFLPEKYFGDSVALERFRREARAASALDHPHICTVYDVGEHEGQPFISMQLLGGQTLKQRIARGPVPLAELLELGSQIADALGAAHAKGIVHRDIKPANIFVTERGDAKVLDFGLAKLTDAEGGNESEAETPATRGDLTSPGSTLGTVAFMSPEQALGKPLDARTDLFSLGVVLYAMATGALPFRGDTSTALVDEILHKTPVPPVRLNPELPDELQRIIDKCLEKDRDLRCQSASELRADLKRLSRDSTSGSGRAVPAAGRRPRAALAWVAVGAAAGIAALGWWGHRGASAVPPPGPMKLTPFTTDGGDKGFPALSPDGEKVAYSWRGPGDDSVNIYLKEVDPGARPIRVTDTPADEGFPAWSPDGRRLAFVRGGANGMAIYTMPSLGGQEQRLVDVAGPAQDAERLNWIPVLSWSPDGEWIAFSEQASRERPPRVVRVVMASGERRPTTDANQFVTGLYPTYSPDGRHLAIVRGGLAADVWVQAVAGGEPRQVTHGRHLYCGRPAWTPDGKEILVSCMVQGVLRAMRVGLDGGDPTPLTGLGQNTSDPSVRGGRMVYREGTNLALDIWTVPGRQAPPGSGTPRKLIASSTWDGNPAFSPDGRRIAFESMRTGVMNIWICDADGSNPVQLTTFEAPSAMPRWAPDGRRLTFYSMITGDSDVYVIGAEGGSPRALTREPGPDSLGTWSRDGRFIYFSSERSGSREIWKVPAEGSKAVQVTEGGGAYAQESFDGRTLYFLASWDRPEVWRMPVEGGAPTRVVSGELAFQFAWAVAADGLYFGVATKKPGPFTIRYLDFGSGEVTDVFRQENDDYSLIYVAVSPDERTILYGTSRPAQYELTLAENFR